MARKVAHLLQDIPEAIDRIESVTRGKSLRDFEGSWEMRWLVQRGIEIISEASRGIPSELKVVRPEVPWAQVRDIGNVCGIDTRPFPIRSSERLWSTSCRVTSSPSKQW